MRIAHFLVQDFLKHVCSFLTRHYCRVPSYRYTPASYNRLIFIAAGTGITPVSQQNEYCST